MSIACAGPRIFKQPAINSSTSRKPDWSRSSNSNKRCASSVASWKHRRMELKYSSSSASSSLAFEIAPDWFASISLKISEIRFISVDRSRSFCHIMTSISVRLQTTIVSTRTAMPRLMRTMMAKKTQAIKQTWYGSGMISNTSSTSPHSEPPKAALARVSWIALNEPKSLQKSSPAFTFSLAVVHRCNVPEANTMAAQNIDNAVRRANDIIDLTDTRSVVSIRRSSVKIFKYLSRILILHRRHKRATFTIDVRPTMFELYGLAETAAKI
mmetsp:Transcript_70321/g.168504  ORF Transcript_70321/g.168504 Transcript_70321/m.168504 type:complete len:269 (-) Transcript_70321:1170-1976(-)